MDGLFGFKFFEAKRFFEELRKAKKEAFKRKKRKYIGLLPILGGGSNPPTNQFPGFSSIKHVK